MFVAAPALIYLGVHRGAKAPLNPGGSGAERTERLEAKEEKEQKQITGEPPAKAEGEA